MNKEKLQAELKLSVVTAGDCRMNRKVVPYLEAKGLISQLDEPEKPVVKQFVADWFERRDCRNLDSAITYECSILNQLTESEMSKFDKWFESEKNPIETIIKMKLYGYEVEKEKLFHMPVPYLEDAYYRNDDLKGLTSFKKASKFTQTELDEHFPDIKHMAVGVQNEQTNSS